MEIEQMVPDGDAYLEFFRNLICKNISGARVKMSELKCCKRCSAFATCDHKGECCIECEHFDPLDMLCMAGPEKKTTKIEKTEQDEEIDPATFLFEDDDDDDDTSDLPPERDADADDDDDW